MLNIQSLVVRSPPHSSLSSKCAEGKLYNEKMQFAQTIIHNIYIELEHLQLSFCAKVEEVSVQKNK